MNTQTRAEPIKPSLAENRRRRDWGAWFNAIGMAVALAAMAFGVFLLL
jgi:hypothetical protein